MKTCQNNDNTLSADITGTFVVRWKVESSYFVIKIVTSKYETKTLTEILNSTLLR